jgi:hypothetical protein
VLRRGSVGTGTSNAALSVKVTDTAAVQNVNASEILHIVPDDKFSRQVVASSERGAPGRNTYISVSSNGSHLHESLEEPLLQRVTQEDAKRIAISPHWRMVVFHSLPVSAYPIVRSVGAQATVVWRIWGYEIYGSLLAGDNDFPTDFLEPETRQLSALDSRTLRSHFRPLRRAYERAWARLAVRRVDLLAPVIPVEGRILLGQNRWLRASLTHWPYTVPTDDRTDCDEVLVSPDLSPGQTYAVLGHSGDPKNNHLDAAIALQSSGLWESVDRVLVPVSYGPASYIERLRMHLRRVIPNSVFLENFMPRDTYFALLANAKFVVHYGLRQIGLGNIDTSLRAETPIILNPKGMLRRHFDEFQLTYFSADAVMSPPAESFSRQLALNKLRIIRLDDRAKEALERLLAGV